MALISITNLTFCHEGSFDNIFTDASVQIDTDWKLGLVGRNGRGKTTLLNLLMGKYEYRGKISTNCNFDYFPIAVENADDSTQEVLEKIAPTAELWQIQKELSKLDLDDGVLYRPFNTLSNGEQTKVLLAGLFLRENNFLLIDEPTNHLDFRARQTVAKYLKGKAGFILVSHDRAFLNECVDHILAINKNNIEVTAGNFSTWAEQKRRQDVFEQGQNDRLESEIGRLKKAAAETSRWADKAEKGKYGVQSSGLKADRGFVGAKAAKMMKSSKNLERRQQSSIEEKKDLLKNIETAEDLKLKYLKYSGDCLVRLSGIRIVYDGRQVLENFNLILNNGDRLVLNGGNGSGKSSILKLIMGENIPHTGTVHLGSRLIVSYVPQDASFLTGNLRDYAREQVIDETLFKSILHKLDFSRIQFEKDMKDFSAGQKKKVLIARSLCQEAHLYIWDEPLNYIDVLSRMQIEDLLLTYKPTMIFVEHDKVFTDKVATIALRL